MSLFQTPSHSDFELHMPVIPHPLFFNVLMDLFILLIRFLCEIFFEEPFELLFSLFLS